MFNGIPKLTRDFVKSGYVWTYEGVLTEPQARDMQCLAGFHVSGYGFYGFRVNGEFTIWRSMNNCE